jgi:hypothetical protein
MHFQDHRHQHEFNEVEYVVGDLRWQVEFGDVCEYHALNEKEDAEDHHKGDGIVCVFFPEKDYRQ